MILPPPDELVYQRFRSFPAAETVAERFALLDATFAALHASGDRLWMAVAGGAGTGEVVVVVGSSPASSEPDGDGGIGWPGSDSEPVEHATVESWLSPFAESTAFAPAFRPDADPPIVDVDAPSLLDQLRMLEHGRNPADVALVVECRRVSDVDAGYEIDRLLGQMTLGVANQSRSAGVEEWTSHHRARAGSEELSRGLAAGLWTTTVALFGTSNAAVGRGRAAVEAGLRLVGPYSLATEGNGGGDMATGRFLGSLGVPPFGEIPGFRSVPVWNFDQTQERRETSTASLAHIGAVMTPTGERGGSFELAKQNIVRHTLVSGATGSGKTETVKKLVSGLDEVMKVPFLIIEPAKSEYRHIRLGADRRRRPLVIRPGDPASPSVMFNPLEPEPGFPLRTHVDLVHALFLAAFEPVDPLPQILAASIDRVYRDAGWVVPIDSMTGVDRPPTSDDYPTLADLQRAASAVVEDIGYAGETLGNVRGFVDVRLGSLRLGTAGGMLERGYPVDFASLMSQQVVFELDEIGNDQEKSFLMGVLLVRLYEFLRCRVADDARRAEESKTEVASRPLSHVTIVEEAHRLLRAAVPGEKPNFAVESFANMLAELRSYGEGLIVVEQVPSKIIPDAVKNTGTKILHRLPAYDDREFAGMAANVRPDQLPALGSLPPGQAICFTDEMDHPCRVAIDRVVASEEGIAPLPRPTLEGLVATTGVTCTHGETLCSLGSKVGGQSAAAQHTALAFWLEIAFPLLAGSRVVRLPSSGLRSSFAELDGCARCSLIDEAVSHRRDALRALRPLADSKAALAAVIDAAFAADPSTLAERSRGIFGDVTSLSDRRRQILWWGDQTPFRSRALIIDLRNELGAKSADDVTRFVFGPLPEDDAITTFIEKKFKGVFE